MRSGSNQHTRKRWWGLVGVILVGLLILGGVGLTRLTHPAAATATSTTVKQPAKVAKKRSVPRQPPLTTANLAKHPQLKYACIIYYAVKHLKIQRWQEVSDFDRGWQVEVYPNHGNPKYLVWPDKHIQEEAKQLEPNWFTINASQQVTYDSFGVHTFSKDQTATVSEKQIIKQIQADHATKRIYAMLDNLVIKKH